MVPGPSTCPIAPSSGMSSTPSPLPASCGVHFGGARNGYSTVITNQSWTFGQRVPPVTPSLCTLFVQSSFVLHPTNSLFLSLTSEVQTIQSLMLCFVFRCSGSANLPRRQIWNPRLCLPQRRPCGRPPSLSAVPSHCTFHTSHLLRWNSQIYYLLFFKAMEPLPCIRVTTTLFCLLAL